MNPTILVVADSVADGWWQVYEAALSERDLEVLPRRLREAKDAVMDRIEDSFDTASVSERRLLAAALNTICIMERQTSADRMQSSSNEIAIGTA